MTLQKKAMLIMVAILLIAIGVNTAVLTATASKKFSAAILSKSSLVGMNTVKEIQSVLALGVSLDSFSDLSEAFKTLVSLDESIGYAMVLNTKGTVLFHSDDTMRGRQLTDETSLKAAKSPAKLMQTIDGFYDLSFPLMDAEDFMVGVFRLGVHTKTIRDQLYKLLFSALAIAVGSFIVALGLVYYFITKYVARPIMKMETVAEKIASGDLSHGVAVQGQDEIASLGRAINSMSANLKEMISNVGSISHSASLVTTSVLQSSEEVLKIAAIQQQAVNETADSTDSLNGSITSLSTNADNLLQSSENTSSAILQMSSTIDSVADMADTLNETSQGVASSIQEMAASIQQIADSLQSLSESSEQISSSVVQVNANTREIDERANQSVQLAENVTVSASEKGRQAAGAAIEGMEDIRKSVTELSGVINMLGKRSHDIGKIVNVISDVTDQTNLLALNAAILAAQAGENGQAFAVVADEIKSFAERTALSTQEIEHLIKTVQTETGSSVKKAAEGIKAVERGLGLVKNVDEALDGIVTSSKASTEMSRAIQKATSEQAVGISRIMESIQSMSDQITQISRASKDQEQGTRLIIETTEKTKDLAFQINTATRQQKEGSRQISHAVENVTQQAEQISKTVSDQHRRSEEIVGSMDHVRNATTDLRNSSTVMSESINSLKAEAENLASQMKAFNT